MRNAHANEWDKSQLYYAIITNMAAIHGRRPPHIPPTAIHKRVNTLLFVFFLCISRAVLYVCFFFSLCSCCSRETRGGSTIHERESKNEEQEQKKKKVKNRFPPFFRSCSNDDCYDDEHYDYELLLFIRLCITFGFPHTHTPRAITAMEIKCQPLWVCVRLWCETARSICRLILKLWK